MAGVRLVWSAPPIVLASAVGAIGDRLGPAVEASLAGLGDKLRAYAVSNHPWQNITGEAERSLTTETTSGGSTYKVALFNTSFHGSGLEVWRGGKWGVIPQAMQAHYGEATRAMEQAVADAMRGR